MKKITFMVLLFVFGLTLSACTTLFERDKPLVMTSLFPQYDMARYIGGEHIDVEFLLPPGVDAHNYEPTPRKVMEILDASLLIYTGNAMEPWVPRLIQQDSERKLKLLDLSQNIDLISSGTSRQSDHQNNDPTYADALEDAIEIFEIMKFSADDAVLAYVHGDHWHGTLPTIPSGTSLELTADIVSSDNQERPLNRSGTPNALAASIHEGMPQDIVSIENKGNHVLFTGLRTGITQIVFHWVYDNEIRYTTPPINIQVGKSDNQQGLLDPHIWMDPINAVQMAEDIRDALIAILPEHEDAFNENAARYIEKLYEVHDAYNLLVRYRKHNVLMHGGHNAFGYLAHRYDFSYVNPYRGFSPDAEPTPQTLADMIDSMEELDIHYLFSEILIDPKVADAIINETGAEILYLYAGENLPVDKLNEGFTFIDVFYHNLEQFKIGLKYDGP